MRKNMVMAMAALMVLGTAACASTMDEAAEPVETVSVATAADKTGQEEKSDVRQKMFSDDNAAEEADGLEDNGKMDEIAEFPHINAGETATGKSIYVDQNGDTAIIPDGFTVSENSDENMIHTGLVVIGPDENEFVWVSITETEFSRNDFGSSGFYDETDSGEYQSMAESVEKYGGFYMGRYEASYAGGSHVTDYIPASRKADSDSIWVHVPPQDMIQICQNLFADNESVTGFLPWGINWDTTLQWLIDSGDKLEMEVVEDSTGWGNYSNNTFVDVRDYGGTGQWEETRANNIYDLAGNYWEWTQERSGGEGYAVRGGGYNIMGGDCTGYHYPVVFRSGLPGNDHHPNITFRVALYLN